MFARKVAVSLMAGFMVLGLTTAASADCRKKIDLNETGAAISIDASGKAEAREQAASQRFKVSMDARVPNGTTYSVFANGQLAGTITISLGDGELELNNNNGKVLPAGTDPVCSISTVEVRDGANTVILSGSF